MKKAFVISTFLAATTFILFLWFGTDPHRVGVAVLSARLLSMYSQWEKAGKPAQPVISNYVSNGTDDFFVNTNTLVINGNQKEGIFGVRSSRLPEGHWLVITLDKKVILVGANGGTKVIE